MITFKRFLTKSLNCGKFPNASDFFSFKNMPMFSWYNQLWISWNTNYYQKTLHAYVHINLNSLFQVDLLFCVSCQYIMNFYASYQEYNLHKLCLIAQSMTNYSLFFCIQKKIKQLKLKWPNIKFHNNECFFNELFDKTNETHFGILVKLIILRHLEFFNHVSFFRQGSNILHLW